TRRFENIDDSMLCLLHKDIRVEKRHDHLFLPVAPLSHYRLQRQEHLIPLAGKKLEDLLLLAAFRIEDVPLHGGEDRKKCWSGKVLEEVRITPARRGGKYELELIIGIMSRDGLKYELRGTKYESEWVIESMNRDGMTKDELRSTNYACPP